MFSNSMDTPSSIDTSGLQSSSSLILDISAKVQSGSPGRLGILTVLPPISFAILFTDHVRISVQILQVTLKYYIQIKLIS
mgnify:CR=1 FL=1